MQSYLYMGDCFLTSLTIEPPVNALWQNKADVLLMRERMPIVGSGAFEFSPHCSHLILCEVCQVVQSQLEGEIGTVLRVDESGKGRYQ